MRILALLILIELPIAAYADTYHHVRAKSDIASIQTAISLFYLDTGRFPTTEEGLTVLVAAPATIDNWEGPYVQRLPVDPWGNPYVYQLAGETLDDVRIYSFGRNVTDDQGFNDDISSWSGFNRDIYDPGWNSTKLTLLLLVGGIFLAVAVLFSLKSRSRRTNAA